MEGRAQERSEVLEQFSRVAGRLRWRDDAGLSITMIIRKHNAILYASAGAPMGVKNTRLGKIERIHSDGRSWTSRTLKSANSDVEVTLVTPAAGWNFFIYLNSRGYYIMPLLVCIPFLLFPAWLSIRIAMRPWNNVVNEIASRAPEDLSVKGCANAPGA